MRKEDQKDSEENFEGRNGRTWKGNRREEEEEEEEEENVGRRIRRRKNKGVEEHGKERRKMK